MAFGGISNTAGMPARSDRAQADARGVPADIMMPRILLVVATILLVLLGLVMVFSASTVEAIDQEESIFSYLVKQVIFVVAGVVGAVVVARFVPYHAWRQGPLFWVFWGIGCALLVAVLVMGTKILGAQRWIYIGSFSLQPTEFVKIILIIAGARVMCEFLEEERTLKEAFVAFVALVLAPLGFLFVTQSDMGSAIIIAVGLFAVMWLGEVPTKFLVALAVCVVVVGALAMTTGYRAERLQVWIDPWNDGKEGYGKGFQVIRSYYAFAEGGIFGVGLGNSREKFLYLPEAETDFIYAIIGEELGLIGAVAVIALFLTVLFAGLRIAAKAPDAFGRILAGSLTVMLVGQAFLNMACATGLFPTTGKPLPFVSSGGSSVIASLLIVGVIMSVSYGSNVLTPYERRRNDLTVIRVERESAGRSGRIGSVRGSDRSSRRRAADSLALPRTDAKAPLSRGGSSRGASSASSGGIRLGTGRDRTYFDDRKRS